MVSITTDKQNLVKHHADFITFEMINVTEQKDSKMHASVFSGIIGIFKQLTATNK